jgi:hypothetical protein
MTNVDFKTVLEGLGYTLFDRGKEWRTKPIYRDSDNDSSLRILKDSGKWIDFARGTGGDFKKLVEISGGKFDGNLEIPVKKETIVSSGEVFDKNELESLQKNHSYWNERGISDTTLELFLGGVIPKTTKSAMYNRYVFPIKNNRNEFIGISGRWIGKKISKNTPKWKHLGSVDSWVYPAFLNKDDILNKKEIILVESIGDGLALWEAGVKNFLVLFGLKLGRAILKSLIAADPDRIIISTNNDADNNFAGNSAAERMQQSLFEFFNKDQIEIRLPKCKDWGESSQEEINNILNG